MCKYTCEDVKNLYKEMERTRGAEAYKYISEVFEQAKDPHKDAFLKRNPNGIHEQSWHRFKGSCFEKLLHYILEGSIEDLNLKVISGNRLDGRRLSQTLDAVKRNVLVNFGEFGMRLPDADLVVYDPENLRVIAIISSKTSLAERVAQTGYWKLKLLESQNTKHIKVYLITSDRGKKLTRLDPATKSRVIAEVELDGTYVLTTEELEGTEKVKLFEHFIEDLKQVIEKSQ